MIKRGVDWLGGGLDMAGMAPVPVIGGLANAANSALEFSRGNWRGGLTNAAMVPLGMVGLGGIGKGLQMGAKYAPRAFSGVEALGKGLQKLPGASSAFGTTRQFAGAGYKFTPGQPIRNVGRAIGNTFMGGAGSNGLGGFAKPFVRGMAKDFAAGPTGLARQEATQQGTEARMKQLGGFINSFSGYGAQSPGSIGPHNSYLTGGPGGW